MHELDRTRSAGYLANWAARLFAKAVDQRLKKHGLSSGQLPVFFALANGRAMTQKQLAAAASIGQPTMAATLARMERQGLIERTPDPKDRRSSLVKLSPAAREKAVHVMEATSSVNAEVLAGLEPGERETFLENLNTVIATLSRSVADET